MDYLRRKVIPTATLDEVGEVIFFYSKNMQEKGEIQNLGDTGLNFFEELVNRANSELEQSLIAFQQGNLDSKILKDSINNSINILMSLGYLQLRTNSILCLAQNIGKILLAYQAKEGDKSNFDSLLLVDTTHK